MIDLPSINVPTFARVTDYAGAWAIEPTAGAALWQHCQSMDLARHVAESVQPKLTAEVNTIKSGNSEVAVVMLAGPMMKSVGSAQSGTSTVQARRELRKAANDPNIGAILIAIDSPGGTVAGTADLGAEIAAAGKKKPVWAYIDDMGASAAYWAASQADKIFANTPSALVGSIGTLSVIYDMSKAAETAGIKTLVFGTGPLKGTGTPGSSITQDQQDYIRGIVEDAQVSFDAAVRKGRNLTERQLETVRTGGVFSASEAISLKLIDGIKSFDAVVAELAAEARRSAKQSNSRAADAQPVLPTQRSITVDETTLKAAGDVAADALKVQRETAAAEYERHAGIAAKCAKHPTIAAQAIREGWTVDKAELAALRAEMEAGRSVSPNIVTGVGKWNGKTVGDNCDINAVLGASLAKSLGTPGREKAYSENVLQAADDNFRSMGLQQLIMTAAVANGYDASPGQRITEGNLRPILRSAFTDRQAGFSTVSLPGILGTTANKELLAGYMEDDQTWREVAAVKSVSNFQQVTAYRLLDSMEYEQVGPAGKIKHGTVGEESYTRQANTYAKMFVLTRRDIINDDLGAFGDIRQRLGRGQSKKFNNVFWTEFMSNASTFWTTARTNYIEGSTTNLGTDGVGLGLGVKAFRMMTSPSADGAKRIGGRPEILLIPPELEAIADNLYANRNLGNVKVSDANIYAGKYRPVVSAWLSDSEFTGYSTTAWFLLRNAADLAAVHVSFLNGNTTPTIESADADFDTLGIQFRGYHDFGVDQAEYLAGVKSKGAA